MTANKGVVIAGSRNLDHLVTVKDIKYPTLEDDLIIVKGYAYAVNPTDWKHILPELFVGHIVGGLFKKLGFGIGALQSVFGCFGTNLGFYLGKTFTYLGKGSVVGSDVSGVVVEVGKNVTRFKKGDIVSSSLHGGISSNGGFADYVLVSPNATIKFPESQILSEPLSPGDHGVSSISSFEAAATLGVGFKTVGLSFHVNLQIPTVKSQNKDDYILIWGGATATGILAIQVAKLIYGINVLTTASKKNHELLKGLGADKVFDYNDPDVVEKLKAAGNNRIKYALDTVSNPQTLQSVYDATEGSGDVTIDNLLFLDESAVQTKEGRKVRFTQTNGYLVDGRTHFGEKAPKELIDKFLEFYEDLAPTITGKLKTTPLKVLPPGYESANEGLKLLVENKVLGQKVVFRNSSV